MASERFASYVILHTRFGEPPDVPQDPTMFDFASLRQQFPGLQQQRDGRTPIFLDGPAGTQVPQLVIDAMVQYLTTCNANHGGVFATSRDSDVIVDAAHQAMADLLNAPSPEEIVFGQNMTSLTFSLSRAIAVVLEPGDEVMVTRLDHDANVTPWVLAAQDAGAIVRFIDIHPEDCTLDLDSFRAQLSVRTQLVAVGLASNGMGTINDVATIAREAREAGAWVFADAVHYAPHGPIDVQALGVDFLACSAYKFFGPHVGVLWGRRELLDELPAYKVRPSPDTVPGRWMTGTQNHEGLAGVAAAGDYLDALGGQLAEEGDCREQLRTAMTAIRAHEQTLSRRLLAGLAERPRFRVWGVTDLTRLDERVPTVAITARDVEPQALAEYLGSRQIYVWSGNMYALEVSERLGLESAGGFVRLGMVHYNTPDEVDRVLQALDEMPAE
jgi:cysteine desulfurase family protein (TIGR01976 family)